MDKLLGVYWSCCDRVSPYTPGQLEGFRIGSTLGLEGRTMVRPKSGIFDARLKVLNMP